MDMLEEALGRGRPEVFNTDQGVQFTAQAWTGRLERAGVAVSMDGRRRWLDNVFVERLWRSVKHEDVYLRGYEGVPALACPREPPCCEPNNRRLTAAVAVPACHPCDPERACRRGVDVSRYAS